MPSEGYKSILDAAMAAGLDGPGGAAHSVIAQPGHDEIAWVAQNDPVMGTAMAKARATLRGFLDRAATAPGSQAQDGFAVKVAIREDGRSEYFWIHPFERRGYRFFGRLNNAPAIVRKVRLGDVIAFTEREIVDWLYMENGRMKGNFTARALLRRASPQEREEFRKRFGLDGEM